MGNIDINKVRRDLEEIQRQRAIRDSKNAAIHINENILKKLNGFYGRLLVFIDDIETGHFREPYVPQLEKLKSDANFIEELIRHLMDDPSYLTKDDLIIVNNLYKKYYGK